MRHPERSAIPFLLSDILTLNVPNSARWIEDPGSAGRPLGKRSVRCLVPFVLSPSKHVH